MAPAWLVNILTQFGLAALKWAVSEANANVAQARAMAEKERIDGIRDGKNAKAYAEAKTRAEQIAAAVSLINRNNGV